MRIILDSNEYILGLDTTAGPSPSSRLLDLVRILIDESEEFRLLIPEIIVREVQRNLPAGLEKDFFRLIRSSQKIEHRNLLDVPKSTFQKYRRHKGLKQADALIAAFAEHMGVDYIVSENRHIYRDLKSTSFISLTAQDFLDLLQQSGEEGTTF
jgi:predicted nucleic acid-binding protein